MKALGDAAFAVHRAILFDNSRLIEQWTPRAILESRNAGVAEKQAKVAFEFCIDNLLLENGEANVVELTEFLGAMDAANLPQWIMKYFISDLIERKMSSHLPSGIVLRIHLVR